MNSNNTFEAYCVKCKDHTLAVNGFATTAKNGQNMLKGECNRCGCRVPKMIAGRNPNMQQAFTEQRREAGVTRKTKSKRGTTGAAASAKKTKVTKKQQAAALYGAAPIMNIPYGCGMMPHDDDEDSDW